MKIQKVRIEKISELIIKSLIDKKLIQLKVERQKLKNRIVNVFMQEVKKEEALDKEVSALIEKNKAVLGNETIDYQRMFTMIKVKLAKEKGVVL